MATLMAKVVYKASLEKFVDSLTPEQIIFLGSLIEADIGKKDFVLLDQLANIMFERVKDMNKEKLHEETHRAFSQINVEPNDSHVVSGNDDKDIKPMEGV